MLRDTPQYTGQSKAILPKMSTVSGERSPVTWEGRLTMERAQAAVPGRKSRVRSLTGLLTR